MSSLPPLRVSTLVARQCVLVLLVQQQVLREFHRDFPRHFVGVVVPVVVALSVIVQALLPDCCRLCMHDNTRTLRSASPHQPTTLHCMHLLLSTMLRHHWWRRSISSTHTALSSNSCMLQLRSNDGTNKLTDARPFHKPCSAYYVSSVNNIILCLIKFTCMACYNSDIHQLSWILLPNIHTYIHPFNGPLSGTTQVSRYQKDKTNLDLYWSKR